MPDVKTIANDAFKECYFLKTTFLPNVTSIGNNAFWSCFALTTIDLPNVKKIGQSAFQDCTSLTTINLPKATEIGYSTFEKCTSLTTINFGTVTPPALGTTIFNNITDTSKITLNIPYNADLTAWRNAFDSKGYTAVKIVKQAPPSISITTPQADFINGTVGTTYSVQLSGSANGFTYTLDSGELPDGLTLSVDGLISGTPTKSGTFTFTVKATNPTTTATATQTYTIIIA